MERFAKIKNVGSRRKLDINAICRCCGLESDDKYPVLGQNPFSDDGVNFSEKVSKLTGIHVTSNDRMPPNMCIMCLDKINDFYEFRLMAENTETQTRQALGLPPPPPVLSTPAAPRIIIRQKIVEVKTCSVPLKDIKYSVADQILINRAFGVDTAKHENIPTSSKKRADKTPSAQQPPAKKPKKELSCRICKDAQFSYLSDLNDHLMKEHIPTVAKYACGSLGCRETFEQFADYKEHENKHSKEKLPYTCFICEYSYGKLKDFNKHMTNYNCKAKEKLSVTVEDIKCFQCKKKFLTQNLFEWHACFLKTRGSCSKCGQQFTKKSALFKHYVLCEGRFETPDAALDPTMRFKMENSGFRAPVKVSTAGAPPASKKTKGPKKKTVPNRKMSTAANIVKSELQLDAPPPPEDDEYANYEEDITYDNFGNDSDSGDVPDALSLEPQVDLQEQPAVQIKQERASDPPAVQDSSNGQKALSTAEMIRNIKKEKCANQTMNIEAPPPQIKKNMLALKIKAERSGSDQPVVQVLNPLAVGGLQTVKKKVFKMPQQLAMKIKMEKKDAEYGDVMEERDEAEPEDEDLMPSAPPSPQVNIKEEKIDPAYGDGQNLTVKMEKPDEERDEAEPEDEDLIGDEPEASIVEIKKEKMDVGYGDAKATVKKPKQFINPMALMMKEKATMNGFQENSLVISAVTSINSEMPEEPPAADGAVESQEPPGTTDGNNQPPAAEKSREASPKMVQIPEDCINDNSNIPMDTSDDLDALLKIYETDAAPTDNNDLFQELLKFD